MKGRTTHRPGRGALRPGAWTRLLRWFGPGAWLAGVALAGLAGCDDSAEVEQLVAFFQTDDQTDPVVGEPSAGAPEAGSAAAPGVSGPRTLLAGSQGRFELTSDLPIDAALLSVSGQDGFFRLALPGELRAAVVVGLAPEASPGAYELRFQTETGSDAPSQPRLAALDVLPAGDAGELLVTLQWTEAVDLDLHVLEPFGLLLGPDGAPAREEIYWASPASLAGGQLDIDTNASCLADDLFEERVTWLTPLAGTYDVYVDLWSACDVTSPIGYTVTRSVRGEVVETVQGAVTPADQTMGSACVVDAESLDGGVPDPSLGNGLASRCPLALQFGYALPD